MVKPRLGESSEELWKAVKNMNVSGFVTPGGGIYYPVIQIVAGKKFVLNVDNEPMITDANGLWVLFPERWELDELDDAIEKDQVLILILTKPGYESGYIYQKIKMVLHSPSGNSFK